MVISNTLKRAEQQKGEGAMGRKDKVSSETKKKPKLTQKERRKLKKEKKKEKTY